MIRSNILQKKTGNSVILTLIFLFVIFLVLCTSREATLKEKTERADAAIAKSSDLKRLDEMCFQIPKPGEFALLGKSLGRRRVSVNHILSMATDFEKTKDFYNNYFANKGWSVIREGDNLGRNYVTFRKGYDEIEIFNDGYAAQGGSNYSFTCEYKP